MAWFAVMGADSVAYHEENVLGRADDHPGQALDYYGTRGETPLRWGGAVAEQLGLQGEVTPEAFRAVFGPGGCRKLTTRLRLGFEVGQKAEIDGFHVVDCRCFVSLRLEHRRLAGAIETAYRRGKTITLVAEPEGTPVT